MLKRIALLMGLLAAGVSYLVPYVSPQTAAPVAQETQVGTIEGTVTRQGTTEAIPDVQITVGGVLNIPGLNSQSAQAILDNVARGTATIPDEILQDVQKVAHGGAAGNALPPLTAVSDSGGHFFISNVPVGNPTVRAQLEGYFGATVDGNTLGFVSAVVTVKARQISQVSLSMIPGGTITGRVHDAAGKPLADTPVQALQSIYQNGLATFVPLVVKTTDDRGEYRLYRIPPGDYYLMAAQRRIPPGLLGNTTSSSSEVPVATLYPNATSSADAQAIALHSGDELSGMNIQIRTASGSKVSGKVISAAAAGPIIGAGGQPRPSTANLSLVLRGANALPGVTVGPVITANADGTFEFSNVLPGSYDIFARLPAAANTGWGAANPPASAGAPWAFGRTPIDVRGVNVGEVSVLVHQGVDLKGQIFVDGKPGTANVRISLMLDETAMNVVDPPARNSFAQIMQFRPGIQADGSFTVPFLPEGKYRFEIGLNPAAPPLPALPVTAYVADIRQGNTSVYDNGLVVGSGALNPIQILLNTNAGSAEVTVTDGRDRQPVPGMTVILVPAENRRQNPSLYQVGHTNPQGRFVFSTIPPGLYKVFAWEHLHVGAYQNAEYLARYETLGSLVTVGPGTRATVEAAVIREVR